MTLWVILVVLLFAALAFLVLPLYRSSGRLTLLLAGVILFAAGLSASLYHRIGHPGVLSGASSMPDVNERMTLLAERLADDPDDVDGWIMLGRSYQTMQQFGAAASAFEKALVLEPDNQNALFFGGGAAARLGDTTLAVERWEILLKMDAPPEVRELMQQKINEWRGVQPKVVGQRGSVVEVNLSVSAEAAAALTSDATVYVIARDPSQPSPPIAVVRRRLSELPVSVPLSDRDAMIPGRPLSGFSSVEIVARVSVSGEPIAQSGDWSGSLIVGVDAMQAVDLVIDQQIP